MPVAIVINECAAGVPAFAVPANSSFLGDVSERAITIVVIKNILAEVAHEKVFETVVIVIADADALSPTGVADTSFLSYVGKRAVPIVLKKM